MIEREKPKHDPILYRKGTSNQTHRCFYIDGEMIFAFFVDKETDINKILYDFLRHKDFISLKEYCEPEWDHIGLVDYFPESNEIFLSTSKKYKNIIDDNVSSKVLYKETQKKLAEERKIQNEKEANELQEQIVKENAEATEKEAKRQAKLTRKLEKEAKQKAKKNKKKSEVDDNIAVYKLIRLPEHEEIKSVQQDVQEVEDVIKDIEKIKSITKTGSRSLI